MFSYLDPQVIITTFGMVGVLLILFAESGTFLGFILPGDSLLFTAGLLASDHTFNIWLLIILGTLAAILGDQVGYWSGRKVGPLIFTKENSFLFRRERLVQAKNFYDKHGKKTIILARFLAVIRMFAPILAGVAEMEYKQFFMYNSIGGFLWVASLSLIGYFLGKAIPGIDQYVLFIIIGIIIVSMIPLFIQIWKNRKKIT